MTENGGGGGGGRFGGGGFVERFKVSPKQKEVHPRVVPGIKFL